MSGSEHYGSYPPPGAPGYNNYPPQGPPGPGQGGAGPPGPPGPPNSATDGRPPSHPGNLILAQVLVTLL